MIRYNVVDIQEGGEAGNVIRGRPKSAALVEETTHKGENRDEEFEKSKLTDRNFRLSGKKHGVPR